MSLLKWKKGGLKSPLARARGLGSAHDGVEHWMLQRITSITNLILTAWLLASLLGGIGTSYESFVNWLRSTENAILMIFFVISTFLHAYLGSRVVVEDYIHNEAFKMMKLIGNKIFFIGMALACIFAILKVAFGY